MYVRPNNPIARKRNPIVSGWNYNVTLKNPIATCRNGSAIGSYANVRNLLFLPQKAGRHAKGFRLAPNHCRSKCY